jgi:L-amino acid N-acyltransferase YncA
VTYRIDDMRPGDWDAVRAIYQAGIQGGQATFETEAPGWETWDAGHSRASRLVARAGDQVIGWVALSPVSRRVCYAGVAEFSVYVHPDHHGRGVGAALVSAMIEASERQGIWTLQGSTFPENQASLALQQRFGFRVVGRRERIARHHGIWRDTVITERRSRAVGGLSQVTQNPIDSPDRPA